ncbi:restriction endonuclease subunit S [Alcaligenes aquatilis]|uniref:restriction endonuclease subunit S n=1 Tax=Alcaligenes aquatilis TaxID=323284 RepID=UPI003753CDD4
MSEVIPGGWSAHELEDLMLKIEGGGTPSRANPAFWNGSIPWATVKDLKGMRLSFTEESITESGVSASASRLVPANTPIIATRMAVGKVVVFDKTVAINQDLKAIYPSQRLDAEFFLQWYLENSEKIANLATGSTVKGIRLEILRSLPLTLPPLPEQQKIATILSSVDDVIEKTRAQIDKLKNLKTGMMQELLTQGVGHTEFKDSPLGRIPASWQVWTLGDLASLVTSGSRGWAEYYSDSGPIFVRIGNLTREHINLRFEDTVHVALPDSAEGKRTQLKEGDVLISITADLGVIGVVNASLGEAYVNQHIALVRLKNPVFSRWIGHFLSLGSSQRQFIENNDAGAKAGLNLPTIKKVLVALPGDKEQRELVGILDKIDASIVQKAKKLNQVIYLKKSLMQDLLTGKVRVKVDSPETVAA